MQESKRDLVILGFSGKYCPTVEAVERLWNSQDGFSKFIDIEKPDLGTFSTVSYLRDNFKAMKGVMFLDEGLFYAPHEEIPRELKRARKNYTVAIIHSAV